MRPYLAILIDSFREAIHSRVLIVLLVLITAFFLVLAPISVRDQATIGIKDVDVLSWNNLARSILRGKEESAKGTPARHVWERLDEKARELLPGLLDEPKPGAKQDIQEIFAFGQAAGELLKSLQTQLNDPSWYDEEAFRRVRLGREGRALLERVQKKEELTEEEHKRFNRVLLEGAFPESIRVSPAKSLAFGYAFSEKYPLPVAYTREQMQEDLPKQVITWGMDIFFGIFGIFSALLVTAPLIPQMFEPGSLHLLLSKPVSRSLLYLTKFIGGCSFALLSSAYFAVALWLLLGTRLGVWDARLLSAVPMYAFVFAIYYSVTAIAGLIYRNTVVAVVAGILFWTMCFGLGLIKVYGMDPFVVQPTRIHRLVPAGDSLLAVRTNGVDQWDAEARKWTPVYQSQQEINSPFNVTWPQFGPLYDAEHDQLVSVQIGAFRGAETSLSVGPRSALWPRTRGTALPSGAVGMMLDRESRVVVVTLDGIHRSTRNVALTEEAPKVLGFSVPWGSGAGSFEKVSAGEWIASQQPVEAAIDPQTDDIAVYSRGNLAIWRRSSAGTYSQRATRELEVKEDTELQICLSGKHVLVVAEDGQVLVFDSQSLETVLDAQPEGKNGPRQVRASPDGKQILILFRHGILWQLEDDGQLSIADVPGQKTISAVAYRSSDELLVAHNVNCVSRCDLKRRTRELICRPALNTAEMAMYYGVLPLYTLLPKPGEVRRTLVYLIGGEETLESGNNSPLPSDLKPVVRLDPWQPVWSGAIFLVIMLGIGCIYMERMEF